MLVYGNNTISFQQVIDECDCCDCCNNTAGNNYYSILLLISFHFVFPPPALSPNLAEREYGILRQDPECSVCVLRRIAVFFLSFCCCYIAWPG